MSRLKRITSCQILTAAARAAGLESIDPSLDLGNGLTLETYRATIDRARERQAQYNTLLSQTDEARSLLKVAEVETGTLSERMLVAVAAKYGFDSNEYEKAGGRRKSERRRSKRIVALPAVPEAKAA